MIGFIFIATAICALTILAVVMPMWRSQKDMASKETEIAIYRDQLAEVDRDLARGVLDATEAERTRTEISRRLLAADASARAAATDAPKQTNRVVVVAVAIAIGGAAVGLYTQLGAPGYDDVPRDLRLAAGEERRQNRIGQLEAETQAPISDNLEQFDPQTRELILNRRAATFERPNDLAAWDVLAQTEAAIGQYHRATRAAEKIIAIKGVDTEIHDMVLLVDLMVAGTRGYVSPEAETIAFTILRQEPENVVGQLYIGLMYAQNDRPDHAFSLWRQVIENSPADTLHWNLAASQIGQVAAQIGIDYALPDQRGPTADDLAAAENMSPEDRQAMIQGMVTSLADRLSTEGGPPQDWARLITSLVAIDQPEAAATVLSEAEGIFGGDVQAVNILRRAAQEAGLDQ